MLWLIGQVTIFLVIALIIGLIIGWLLRSMWPSSRTRVREGELEAALNRASGRISDLEAGLRSKRIAAAAAAEQEEAALRKVDELEAALATLHSQSDADIGEVERLQTELDEAVAAIESLRNEMADIHASVDEVAALKAERDAALARLAAAGDPKTEPTQGGLFLVQDDDPSAPGDAWESQIAPSEAAGTTWTEEPLHQSEPDPDPEPDEEEIEAVRLAAVAQVTERFRLGDDVAPDDLKRIYGVGPSLERLLHSMNISTFRQIAEFEEDDIDLVSAALGRAFPDRIRRDDWMGSAQALLGEGEGEDS